MTPIFTFFFLGEILHVILDVRYRYFKATGLQIKKKKIQWLVERYKLSEIFRWNCIYPFSVNIPVTDLFNLL